MTQLKPQEILDATINAAVTKSQLSVRRMIILGILAGAFIALAGSGANMAGYYLLSDPATNGLGKMISGCIFPAGLIMVVFAGAELFTGNNLMLAAVLDKKITAKAMLRNWIVVYLANLAGSILVAWMVAYSGLLETGGGMLKEVTISIAASKAALPFDQAFVRAILCNFLVCLAVWLATGADSTIGKIFSIFFPIWLFVTAGFEHSVANMFFIPAGLFADGGATAGLTWGSFFINNLLPVTLGNLVGGSLLVGGTYYYAFKRA